MRRRRSTRRGTAERPATSTRAAGCSTWWATYGASACPGDAADAARRRIFGETAGIATYLIDRNINYTNVCVTACRFCAFYRAPKHPEGWTRSREEILRRCAEAVELGATQIMLQGGHSPELGIEWYEETFAAVKSAFPTLALHS